MGKVKRLIIILLIASIFCCTGLEAYAATESQDGLSVTLTTDKQSYLPGEAINVSLLLTNGNSFPISSVHAQVSAPEGYILSAGYAESMSTTSLGAGKSLQLATRYLEQNSVPVPLPTLGPDRVGVATGDRANLPLWIALAVVSLAALMLLALRKKIWKRFFCLLLCFAMLGGIAGPVYAANDQVQKTLRVATSVKVGNRDLTVQGVVSYTMGSEVSPSPAPTAVPSPTPTTQPSPTPTPTPSLVPGEYFTVSYQLNYEGAGEYLSQQVEKGSCAQEPTAPARDGYRFMGWYTDLEWNSKFSFDTAIDSNITLYAKWGKIENLDNFSPINADRYISDDLYVDVSDEDHIQFDAKSGLKYIDNELILFVKENTTRSEVISLISEDQGAIVGCDTYVDSFLIRFAVPKEKAELDNLLNKYLSNDIVEQAFLNMSMQCELQYYPVSDRWGEQDWTEIAEGENWGLEAIHAPNAWDYKELMTPVRVGVFDGGCDISHYDLKNVIYTSALAETNNQNRIAHGTHVSGTIGADFDNKKGVNGVCPTAQIAVIDTVWAERQGDLYYWTTALSYLIGENRSRVVNVSLGDSLVAFAASHDNPSAKQFMASYSKVLTVHLRKLLKVNDKFTICVAAGNTNDVIFYEDSSARYGYYMGCYEDHEHNPGKSYYTDNNGKCKECSLWQQLNRKMGGALAFWSSPLTAIEDENIIKHIIVVGSCGNIGGGEYEIMPYSNIGSRVDVLAPGDKIWSTIPSDDFGEKGGTSMASPHVAGTAALLYALKSDISAEEVKSLIVSTATTKVSGSDKMMINAGAAVKKLLRVINATVTDGNSPLSDVTVTFECIMAGFSEQSLTVKTNENGKLDYQLPREVASIKSITFSKEGYRDYKYPQELDMSSFNDLGEIVLSLIPVFDTVEIQATLLDAETGETVTGALIQAFSEEQETPVAEAVSNDKGHFNIALPQFTALSLKITCEGYTTRELSIFLEGDAWTGDEEPGREETGSILYLQKADAFEGFAGGDGTANNPYQIATAAQMDAVRRNLSACYVLIDDIDLSTYSPWVPIGTETAPFTGSLNGDDHTISNLTLNNLSVSTWMESNGSGSQNAFIGLFGYNQDGDLTALTLENVNTEITDNAAVSVGTMYYGSICGWTNNWVNYCTVSGSINISMEKASFIHAGGLVGYATGLQALVDDNVNNASLTIRGGGIVCGGVVGTIDGKIYFCQNYGEINCCNTNGPDLLCGGVVGNAFNSNVARCRNFGDITSKTEGWGWPSSGNYRHQTGGVVGLFQGASSAGNTLCIDRCENSGNISVTSFTGYNVANSCCENDSTGGICGGFVCLSSSKWYGEIINCINYATSICAQRVKDVDGTLEYSYSLSIGRIGPFDSLSIPYYSYSNNTSDPETLLNGAVCTENIGAETKNGANLGEENTEDENGTLNISILEGTWSNGLPEDNYSGFYLTEFGSDGTVVQKGYRNIDKGRFEITGANTAVATFDNNYYETPGVGYQKIADYSYTVTYTYDKYSDTLLANYSDAFENAANSNACDGTFSRWSGTPLHEQIKDIVLGAQEDDTQEQESQDYQSFLISQAYLNYAGGWNSSGETYAILDINQDGVDELIVNSQNESGFMYSLVFTYDSGGQITPVANFYHYGYIRYSMGDLAIEYSELSPTPDVGSGSFYTFNGAELIAVFSVGWDTSVAEDYSYVCYPGSGEIITISQDEKAGYFSNLQNIEWLPLT